MEAGHKLMLLNWITVGLSTKSLRSSKLHKKNHHVYQKKSHKSTHAHDLCTLLTKRLFSSVDCRHWYISIFFSGKKTLVVNYCISRGHDVSVSYAVSHLFIEVEPYSFIPCHFSLRPWWLCIDHVVNCKLQLVGSSTARKIVMKLIDCLSVIKHCFKTCD